MAAAKANGDEPAVATDEEDVALLSAEQDRDTTRVVFPAADFGYSYAGQEQDGESEGKKEEGKPKKAPFEALKFAAEKDPADDLERASVAAVCAFACCCVLGVLAVVIGAFVLGFVQQSGGRAGGASLLAVGVLMLLLGMVLGCVACLASCALSIKGLEPKRGGKHQWTFRRLNNRLDGDVDKLDHLRYPVGADNKEYQARIAKERKEKDAKHKEKVKEMDELIKADLEEGLTAFEVQQKRRPMVFMVEFDGDVYVSTIETLREQISICVAAGCKHDTVCVVLTSGGGAVSMYGLAGAQLARVRKAGMELVVCVDSIAASGGYLMATMADRILASPFALVGSIGVIAITPNVQKLLEKHDVRTYVFTAGKYKRTVDVVGDVTEEGKRKMHEELEVIHQVFKDHICHNRPALEDSIEDIATGEAWLGVEAKQKGLVDEILTSDEYLTRMTSTHDVVRIEPKARVNLLDDFVDNVSARLSRSLAAPMSSQPLLVG